MSSKGHAFGMLMIGARAAAVDVVPVKGVSAPSEAPGWPSGLPHSLYAYITLATDGYLRGVVALAASLADVRARWPLVIMHPDDQPLHPAGLQAAATCLNASVHPTVLVRVPAIANPTVRQAHARFRATYHKLNAFHAPFQRILYLDADTIVLRNIDHLLDRDKHERLHHGPYHLYDERVASKGTEEPAFVHSATHLAQLKHAVPFSLHAVPDRGVGCHTHACLSVLRPGRQLNAGVLLLEPSTASFVEMCRSLQTVRSTDGSEQGFLNRYLIQHAARENSSAPPFWQLPDRYNRMVPNVHAAVPGLHNNTNVLHFLGAAKPWRTSELADATGTAACAAVVRRAVRNASQNLGSTATVMAGAEESGMAASIVADAARTHTLPELLQMYYHSPLQRV